MYCSKNIHAGEMFAMTNSLNKIQQMSPSNWRLPFRLIVSQVLFFIAHMWKNGCYACRKKKPCVIRTHTIYWDYNWSAIFLQLAQFKLVLSWDMPVFYAFFYISIAQNGWIPNFRRMKEFQIIFDIICIMHKYFSIFPI